MKRGTKKLHLGKGKKRAQLLHLRKRMNQRFNLPLTQLELEAITCIIRNGESLKVTKRTNRVTKHLIEYQGKKMIVVYDKIRGVPVTCLYAKER